MTRGGSTPPKRIRERLAGHHILVTGSTGFLAKAFVEKLLRAVDTVGGIHLLVRSRGRATSGGSPEERVRREVLDTRAFDRLRAKLGDRFAKLCEKKIHVVGGDLTKEHLGLDPKAYANLTKRITLVVNSAATVTFDERMDLAVELNTIGPGRLLTFAKDSGNIPFLHVSTCYVCGARTGKILEDFSAPQRAHEVLPRCAKTGDFDIEAVVESMRAEAKELRHRFGADSEACRKQLIEGGMRRARASGWNDTYTFTKWLGEQRLVRDRGNVPLVIFRPAIIEGSYEEPIPGWIDGLRMADPIIIAYGRGKVSEFPAVKDIPLDLIPVDFVANAMIANLPVDLGRRKTPPVYHCASSDRNPLFLENLRLYLERAFRKRPMTDDAGQPIRPGRLTIVRQSEFVSRWSAKQKRIAQLQRLCLAVGIKGRRFRRLAAAARQVEQLLYFSKIYSPYTHLGCRFADDSLRAVADELHPDDRTNFPFDARAIDWNDYIVDRHVPGLRSFVLGSDAEPPPRAFSAQLAMPTSQNLAAETLQVDNLFEMFSRVAAIVGDKPVFQVRRDGRWLRYTYREALDATGAIMQRFVEAGLKPGSCVAICGDNGPEWGLTYLAIMRAGLTAVPLDPQLPAPEVWASARFADANLICATPSTAPALLEHREEGDPDVVVMREPFIPRPGATRDTFPDPVQLEDTAIASILFTSGTTVSPKAVPLTHRNFLANAKSLVKAHPVRPRDELLGVLPTYHAFEFTAGFLIPVASGATITYVDQLRGPEIVSAMQATGTTIMLVVPRLLKMFLDSIERNVAASGLLKRGAFRLLGFLSNVSGHRLGRQLFGTVHKQFGGRLHMFVCGGSRLGPELFEAFGRMGFEVYEGYGLTETSPVLTVNPRGDARRCSVGPALPGVDIEIRNSNLEGIGEVWVRGANVMDGYLGNPEATREILSDGWLRTGDLGRLDADGYLFLTGRSTDLIVTDAGKNVYPDEVEARYCELPYTKEICVFGVPSKEGLGDTVQAVVVIDDSTAPELDRSSLEREIRSVVTSIGESLPSFQRIATLHFWDRELPKTSTLKAKRGLIRDMALAERGAREPGVVDDGDEDAAAASRTTVAEAARLRAVRNILSKATGRSAQSIRLDLHLHLDLGIDSIGKMDVLTTVESRFGMEIDGEIAARIARVSDLLKVIGERKPKKRLTHGSTDRKKWVADRSALAGVNGPLPKPLVPIRWLIRGGVTSFMNSYVRVHAAGREHIPSRGPFVLAPNHSSHLDSPSVLAAMGGKRRVWIAGAEDYFFNTAPKRLLFGRMLDTIPFDRSADGILGLRRCGEALRRGDGLLMFPEGTRSTTGKLRPFKVGVGVLAIEHRAPILPVYIDRTFDLFPKGRRFIKPGAIHVTFGQPIAPPTLESDDSRSEAARTLAERVEAAVIALAGETMR